MEVIINKTPHPVNIVNAQNEVIRTFPACLKDKLIRLKADVKQVGEIDGVPVSSTEFGSPEGLPKERNDVYYIVSQLVASACFDRMDLLVPAEVVRDENGQIVGCRSLGR